MKHGGRRPGQGNVKDSIRPNFTAFWTPEEIREYMEWLKVNYQHNPKLAMWVGDHLFGKAPQPVTGENGGALVISFDKSFDE